MMKNNTFSIPALLLLTILQTLSAQETFLKIYPSTDDKVIYSIIESDDSRLIFCGLIWLNPEWTESIGTLMKMEMDGDMVDSTNYDFEYGNSQFSELINPPTTIGSYYISGSEDSVSADTFYNSLFIHKIDNNMNITARRNFGMWSDTVNDPWDFEILNDSIAYLLSSFYTENSLLQYNYSLIKANLNNGVYDYIVPDDTISKAATSLYIDQMSELVKVNYRVFNLTTPPWNPIAKISYDLSNIEVVMPENEFFSQTRVASINDSTYFISGPVYNDNTIDLGLAEYDLSDSLRNFLLLPGETGSVTYPGMGKRNILATTNYIWIMGMYNPGDFYPPCSSPPTYIMLNKLNYDLELTEQIFYGGDGVYFPKDIIESNDNHIIVAGDFYDNLSYECHSYPFVLKVNSEGLIVNTGYNSLPQAHEAVAVPNPGSDFMKIKLGIQHKTAAIQLFDLNGRLVLSEDNITDMQSINTSALPKGVFPYRISAGNRVIGIGKWIKE